MRRYYFVRDTTDQTVDVYFWGSSKGTNIKTGVTVNPEDTQAAKNDYDFKLKYADANTGAEITSFKLGNVNGSISGQNITVALPFGANLYGQVATFTTSEGAEVYLGSVATSNLLTSGESVLNVSSLSP